MNEDCPCGSKPEIYLPLLLTTARLAPAKNRKLSVNRVIISNSPLECEECKFD